jgi:hypothetical protein
MSKEETGIALDYGFIRGRTGVRSGEDVKLRSATESQIYRSARSHAMKSVEERAKALGSLQTFDSDAFRGDGEVPQELCNVVLAFALVFNDCRDLLFWLDDLLAVAPTEVKISRFFGEHGGGMTHVFRLAAALVHELGELIHKHGKWLHHPFFETRVLAKLDKNQRAGWDRVLDLAHGRAGERAMDQFLKLLRDRATYHYDAEDLTAPYNRRFPAGATEKLKQPYVSRGMRVRNVRFYFADALPFDLIEQEAASRGLMPLGPRMTEILTDVSTALASVVEAFIQARCPWHDFAEEK